MSETSNEQDHPSKSDELTSYLARTSDIDGPRRDLIFGEGVGSPFGLSPEFAELLETDAVDGRVAAVRELLESQTSDERKRAIGMLVATYQEYVGLEARNVLAAVLTMLDTQVVDFGVTPSDVLRATANEVRRESLPLELLPAVAHAAANGERSLGDPILSNVLSDPRLTGEDARAVATDVFAASLAASKRLVDELVVFLMSQPAGFIASANPQEVSSEAVDDFLPTAVSKLGERWSEDPNENDGGDLSVLAALALHHGAAALQWALAATVVGSGREELVSTWAGGGPLRSSTHAQTTLLLELMSVGGRHLWPVLGELVGESTHSEDTAQYGLVARLLQDVASQGEIDAEATSAWELLRRVWNPEVNPFDGWGDELRGIAAPAWETNGRLDRHQRLIGLIDSGVRDAVVDLLRDDYLALAQSGSNRPSDFIVSSVSVWRVMSPETQQSLLAAIDQSVILPVSVKTWWRAQLSTGEGGAEFPIGDDDVLALLDDSQKGNAETVRLWLRHQARSKNQLVLFLRRLSAAHVNLDVYRASVSVGLGRLSKADATETICTLVQERVELSTQSAAAVMAGSFDQRTVASCLAEQLRDASNQDEREYTLEFWSAWAPHDSVARRELLEALRVMAEGSKSALLQACRYLKLASDPPRGVKGSFVQTFQERAKALGVGKEVDKALALAGLIRAKPSVLSALRRKAGLS